MEVGATELLDLAVGEKLDVISRLRKVRRWDLDNTSDVEEARDGDSETPDLFANFEWEIAKTCHQIKYSRRNYYS